MDALATNLASSQVEPKPMTQPTTEPLRLHIGGEARKDGWKILNVQAKEGVDFIGTAQDLSQFADGSVEEIYASHIYEHLRYKDELPLALREAARVLRPGGEIRVAVPDLFVLAQLLTTAKLTTNDRFTIMRMIYGGQVDAFDEHRVGFTLELLAFFLHHAGFDQIERVKSFGLFQDTSELLYGGVPISLNVRAVRSLTRPPGLPYPVAEAKK